MHSNLNALEGWIKQLKRESKGKDENKNKTRGNKK